MKMEHVMAALLFGVVAVGAVQAQEKHYKYYPVTTEVYGGEIINTTDLNESCRMGVNSYNDLWIEPYHGFQVGNGKFQQRWTDYTQYGIPNRQLMCSYQQRSKSDSGGWTEWVDSGSTVVAGFSCRDGGRFLWGDKDFCAEEVSEDEYNKNACDPSYYADGVVPETCPKPDPKFKIPENDRLCQKIMPTKESKTWGNIACIPGNSEAQRPCIWVSEMRPDLKWTKAGEILTYCSYLHENKHISNSLTGSFRTLCGREENMEGFVSVGLRPDVYLDEISAYDVTITCIETNKDACEGDADCLKTLNDSAELMEAMKESNKFDYKSFCKTHPTIKCNPRPEDME